jgi:hypothetical protein
MESHADADADADADTPRKRVYRMPVLVSYGDAVSLTQGRSAVGARPDGGGKSKMRTR